MNGHPVCMELLIKGGVDLNHANNVVSTRPIEYVSPTSPNTRHTYGGGGGDGDRTGVGGGDGAW